MATNTVKANDPRSLPIHKYNPFSRGLFCWIDSLLYLGAHRSLTHEDLFIHPAEADDEYLMKRFSRFWKAELTKHGQNASLLLVLMKCLWYRLIYSSIPVFIEFAAQMMLVIFLGDITDYLSTADCTSSSDTRSAYLTAMGLSLLIILAVICNAWSSFIGSKSGMQLRIMCTGAIYDKILLLSQGSVSRLTIGHILNLASNDVHRMDLAVSCGQYVLLTPFMIIATTLILYNELGSVGFIALGLLVGQIPIQVILSKLLSYLRLKAAKVTDTRIRTMNEIITGIKVIKLYSWENAFHRLVSTIRRNEMMIILKSSVIRAINLSTYTTSLPTILFVMFSVHAVMGECITLRKVFISISILTFSKLFINYHFVLGIANITEASVAIKRIQKFLVLEDELSPVKEKSQNSNVSTFNPHLELESKLHVDGEFPTVLVNEMCCSWSELESELTLIDISFKVDKLNPLLAVVGSVGAGKSTLLQCLLGELSPIKGCIDMEGTVAYAGQEPWIFSDSVRENILFGHPYIPDWYNTVVELCALNQDISTLPDHDLTVIGERGVTLSGGQKARIGLARAVYRKAGIYLLDDPLSAVDAAVSRHIFDRCIQGYLTTSSVVILVTHQLHYVQQCDNVLVLNKGRVATYSNSNVALEQSILFQNKMTSDINIEDINGDVPISLSPLKQLPVLEYEENNELTAVDPSDDSIHKSNELSKEDKITGSVSFATYHNYFKAGGGIIHTFGMIVIYFFAEVSLVVSDIWLADWASSTAGEDSCITEYNSTSCADYYPTNSTSLLPTSTRIGVYGALVVMVWVLCVARTVLLYTILLRAATSLHNKMFISVLQSPLLFFNTNPVGRVLNRFSKDVGFLDDILIYFFCELFLFFSRFLAIVITASIAVYYLIVVIIAILIIFIIFRWYFLKSSREIKRLEAVARSPLYSHISMTLQGLPTIRAYGMQRAILEKFYEFQNKHTQSWYLYIVSSRWFGIRVDLICAALVVLIAFTAVSLVNVLNAGLLGLALTYSLSLTGLFQYCVRLSAEVESLMVSAERLMEYGKLPSEETYTINPNGDNNHPPSGWPNKGCIELTDLCYRHSSDGPLVLDNINCTIFPEEKVGIIGRTGAGKSSLLSAFFRLGETSGSIKIDGVECLDLQLKDLRPCISIIPQDPVLFSGSIRHNLDPFNEYDDENIWTSLKQVQLGSVVESLDGGLEADVTEGGNNFSVGERQLFCLARALLRHNKILMLDEATANVDFKTDSIIQQVIRQHFNKCTVLTVAHRLDTVMDSDHIMVLESGRLVEYDRPSHLLSTPESHLSKLVQQTSYHKRSIETELK